MDIIPKLPLAGTLIAASALGSAFAGNSIEPRIEVPAAEDVSSWEFRLEPYAWLKDVLEKLHVWPYSRIDELLPLRPTEVH